MFIRSASNRDFATISDLVEAAFGRHDEALLLAELRQDGDIALELVATDRDELIGHLALTRLISPAGCLALAPLSAHPDRQHKGIGSALINKAMAWAEEQGWVAVFVHGNPRYYGRFGFDVAEAADFDTVYSSEFMAVRVFDEVAFGSLVRELDFASAF
ncbi:MAG: N-acetyltransferase [Alphaproteobacteria bacterium]|nr:N-acetyltransferase [Alphaproteobacteria bacterium]